MRILVVAKNLPPTSDPESLCTAKLIDAIRGSGAIVDVVTGTPAPSVRADRFHITAELEHEGFLESVNRQVAGYPETGWGWAKNASRLVSSICSKTAFDCIYSRGMPFISHVAVWQSNAWKTVPWAAHFSDPWPQTDFWADPRGRRLRWHRRLVPTMSGLTFPSQRVERVCREQESGLPGLNRRRTLILPHVGRAMSIAAAPEMPRGQPIRLLHCGSLHGPRRPDALIQAMAEIARERADGQLGLEFHQVGPVSDALTGLADAAGLGRHVFQHGPCDYETSLQRMADADALLLVENIDARVGVYLPSKFIDYIWAGRPIMALTPTDGTVADYLGPSYPLRADPWDVGQVRRVLETLIRQPEAISLALGRTTHLRHEFSPDVLAGRLKLFLEALCHQRRCGQD